MNFEAVGAGDCAQASEGDKNIASHAFAVRRIDHGSNHDGDAVCLDQMLAVLHVVARCKVHQGGARPVLDQRVLGEGLYRSLNDVNVVETQHRIPPFGAAVVSELQEGERHRNKLAVGGIAIVELQLQHNQHQLAAISFADRVPVPLPPGLLSGGFSVWKDPCSLRIAFTVASSSFPKTLLVQKISNLLIDFSDGLGLLGNNHLRGGGIVLRGRGFLALDSTRAGWHGRKS